VTTVTNYSTTDSTYSYDNDWTNEIDDDNAPWGDGSHYKGWIRNDRDHDTFGQELRFDSVEQNDALGWIDRWSVGTYFHHLE
jgi:hypothetical protein